MSQNRTRTFSSVVTDPHVFQELPEHPEKLSCCKRLSSSSLLTAGPAEPVKFCGQRRSSGPRLLRSAELNGLSLIAQNLWCSVNGPSRTGSTGSKHDPLKDHTLILFNDNIELLQMSRKISNPDPRGSGSLDHLQQNFKSPS